MSGWWTFCASLWSVVLVGCAVGPDYRPAAALAGAEFVNTSAATVTTAGIDRVWWRRFRDPLLDQLIERAARHNRDLAAAEANLRAARALLIEAGFDLLPTITAQARHTDQKRSLDSLNRRNFVPRKLSLYNAGFDAAWEIDFFGRVRRNLEARGAEVEASEADRRALLVSLIGEVARNYFLLRGLQLQVEVARRNAANQDETLALTQARLDAGAGTELDTGRALAQRDTTLATLPPIEAAIRETIHRLDVLTGQLPGTLVRRLQGAAPLPELPERIRIGKPNELLRRRPDVQSAERFLAAATADIGVVTADLYPRVTFNGTVALESRTLGGLGAAGSDAYSFGPRITWAALDLGRVYARIRAAKAGAEAQLANFEQTVLLALEETETALVRYEQEWARARLLKSAAAASEQAFRLARLRFEDGVEGFLTVLDTERRLLEDQRQLAQSLTATATALVAVYKALGGGWEVFPAASDEPDDSLEVLIKGTTAAN